MNTHDHFIGTLVSWNIFGLVNDYPVITILWNLFLLLIPFFLCKKLAQLWLKEEKRTWLLKMLAVFLFGLWLLFIPNTAYIITDARHIAGACPLNENRICVSGAWVTIFFFTYAVLGWLAYVYLLNQMKIFIKKSFGSKAARVYLAVMPPLTAWGLLLGLINRWNSWDLFIFPREVIRGAFLYFSDWTYFKNLLIYSFFLYLLYFLGNYFFKEEIKLKK